MAKEIQALAPQLPRLKTLGLGLRGRRVASVGAAAAWPQSVQLPLGLGSIRGRRVASVRSEAA